jgi:formate/nitrite transporter FocA (FNT family)
MTDKTVAIIVPVSAFVVAGFEHSVANMYAIPVVLMAGLIETDWPSFLINLAMVSAGNIIGGGVLVALVYWAVYIRGGDQPRPF